MPAKSANRVAIGREQPVTSKNCPLAELLQLGDSLNQNREVQHGLQSTHPFGQYSLTLGN
jgi:hypothetical protein